MNTQSKALEVNIESSRIKVKIEDKYKIFQEIMDKYYGIMQGLNTFLIELSHPYKNWQFIVKEARIYALNYFNLISTHKKGPEAAKLIIKIFLEAINTSREQDVKIDAVDNLFLFIQKIILDSNTELPEFLPVLDYAFEKIKNQSDDEFFLFVKSYYQLEKLAEKLLSHVSLPVSFEPINELLIKYFQRTYTYWVEKEDPHSYLKKQITNLADFNKLNEIFKPISHNQLKQHCSTLESIIKKHDRASENVLKNLIDNLPGYNKIVSIYRSIPRMLLESVNNTGDGNHLKVIFLFHIMNIRGLSLIHEETLRDINLTLAWLIENHDSMYIKNLIRNTFSMLEKSVEEFPETALNSVLNMGKGVYKTNESNLVVFFIDLVVKLGFQPPDLKGVNNEWQIQANAVHIKNVRTWLELIEFNPRWSKKLLSSLIIHLSLSGVFIKDTDLFPRDITMFLNSDIHSVYNLVKQLTRLFPSYFNEIGAEGKLRDISTQMDEMTLRRDELVHFLRKQSHVESSNQTLILTEAVFNFWKTKDKSPLETFIPPNIYDTLDPESYYVIEMNNIISSIFSELHINKVKDLLKIQEEDFHDFIKNISNVSKESKQRMELIVVFYKLLYQKYHLDFIDIDNQLNGFKHLFQSDILPDFKRLQNIIIEKDNIKKLDGLLEYLEKLKDVILSQDVYEIKEDIYRKRHFTIDIPSMYGSYNEMKFNSLGLSFRLEFIVNILFEEIVEDIDLKLITRAAFFKIKKYLNLFKRALKIEGILSVEIEDQLELLGHALDKRGFTFTQYIDIFRGIGEAVKNIVYDYFQNVHEENLSTILNNIPRKHILPKYFPRRWIGDKETLMHRVSEIFFRERIYFALGLRQLDLFITRILKTLFHQADQLTEDKFHSLLNYDPEKAITPITDPVKHITDVIHLGRKAFNLVKLKELGYPVPVGFVITTEIFKSREVIESYEPARQDFRDQIRNQIKRLENITGKCFGDPENPLLLSVRSGSSVSQPGMMDTFLNVGINKEIAEGLARSTGKEWFAWDNYRRFIQIYGMSFGLKRDDFDALIANFKLEKEVTFKHQFTGRQMKTLTLRYRDLVLKNKIEIPEDPFTQLYMAIQRIFDSWDSEKAEAYRTIMKISHDWGTAVTVQSMVYGNITQNAGAGVSFTHSPKGSGDILNLWGDFTRGNQGEDVVAGLVKTLPITKIQGELENRLVSDSLETLFPEIYKAMMDVANDFIYKKGWSPQELEFTFEGNSKKDFYILQIRDMALRKKKTESYFDINSGAAIKVLAHGIGVCGGAMAGRLIFTLDEIREWRKKEPKTLLILTRNDTVPDDIQEIYESDGLLTARGGSTSHASVVAHRLGKTCVVGCANLICTEKEGICEVNQTLLKSGDYISIDGNEGSVYLGLMPIKESKGD
ncbi:pyruvate, orthophosphate dikinase [Candidatus Magnetomoraceae bacterium gMMP-1]